MVGYTSGDIKVEKISPTIIRLRDRFTREKIMDVKIDRLK